MKSTNFEKAVANMFTNVLYKQSYLFYAHVISDCNVKYDNEMCSPAAVSLAKTGYNLHINEQLFGKYKINEQLAILKHECLHIINFHCVDSKRIISQNNDLKNVAYDIAINQLIDDEDLPEDALTLEHVNKENNIKMSRNQSAEYYFKELSKLENPKTKHVENHDKWSETQVVKELTKSIISNAAEKTKKSIGEIPIEIEQKLEIFRSTDKPLWHKPVLNKIGSLKSKFKRTLLKNDRRLQIDTSKGKKKNHKLKILVILDVSASVTDKMIQKSLDDIIKLSKNVSVELIMMQVDAKPRDPQKIKSGFKFVRSGKGATALSNSLQKIKEKKINQSVTIVLTDGHLWDNDILNFKTEKNVFWLVYKNGVIKDAMNTNKMRAFAI